MENSQYTLLVVDDEPDICNIVRFTLEMEGYAVDTAASAEEAQALLSQAPGRYHLLLLDVMMGERSGFDLARHLRGHSATAQLPIIFLTAKAAESDIVTGLNLGADDYIAKPFSNRELAARVKAVLRRSPTTPAASPAVPPPPGDTSGDVAFGDLHLCPQEKRATLEGRDLGLSKTELGLLTLLLTHPKRVFSRQELLDKVWPADILVSNRTVDVRINRVRKKIGPYAAHIVTRQGFGYCFMP